VTEDRGLRFALLLDGKGGATELDWSSTANWTPAAGTLWLHLNREHEYVHRWLREDSGLSEAACDALLAEETRPRCSSLPGGLLLNLRGVNLTPGAAPEDLVSVRIWAEPSRIISVRLRHVDAISDMRADLASGEGACSAGDVLATLGRHLIGGLSPIVAALEDQVDEVEQASVEGASQVTRDQLALVRRQVILLRRYIAPQRQALELLHSEPAAPLAEADRMHIQETTDRIARQVEALDATRERSTLIQELISIQLADQMTRGMYVLSMVAAIFLPLSLLTGLLGINVGGIPGSDHPYAFAIVVAALVVLFVAQIALLRWLRLL